MHQELHGEILMVMTTRIVTLLGSLAEFISRFWPMSKTEETILEEQRALYRTDPRAEDVSADDKR